VPILKKDCFVGGFLNVLFLFGGSEMAEIMMLALLHLVSYRWHNRYAHRACLFSPSPAQERAPRTPA
jgi:hypothetical protein